MDEVCEILESRTQRETTNTSPSDSNSDPEEAAFGSLSNKFSVLEVEEPISWEASSESKPGRKQKTVRYELDETKEQDGEYPSLMIFEIFCLFDDLHKMREFLSQVWIEYRNDEISLSNAAVVTDTAVRLAKQLIEEVARD